MTGRAIDATGEFGYGWPIMKPVIRMFLGLALVSKIIADHDGWIAVDSVPGRTVFRISLPVVPAGAAGSTDH